MVSYRINEPNTVTLITTFRCNASCDMCCFGCRPSRGKSMTLEQMKRYLNICLETYPDSIHTMSLTGGECFLLGENLFEIIKYGHSKGLMVSLVSNGYWGYRYRDAYDIILRFKNVGLTGIAFSCGNDHNHLIPFRSIRNAVVAASRAGYSVGFRIENNYTSLGVHNSIEKDSVLKELINTGKIKAIKHEWLSFSNEKIDKDIPPTRDPVWRKYEWCKNLCNNIPVSPYGDVWACCGIGSHRIPQLRLGNIEKEPIKKIYERVFQDPIKLWIARKGPQDIFRYIYENSRLRVNTSNHYCSYCREIFKNPRIIPFLRSRMEDWIEKIY